MLKVRLEYPIQSGFRGVPAAEFAMVRDLRPEELAQLADAEPDEIMAHITGMSPEMCRRLTANDRANIQAARAAARRNA